MKYVYVAIPSRDKPYWDMYTGLIIAANYAAQKGILCAIDPHVGSSLICRARNDLTYKFLYLNKQCDYFLQLDDDVVIPPTGIIDLVEADKGIVGGIYSLKNKSGYNAVRGLDNKFVDISKHPNEIMEVKYLSGGCIMQTREFVQHAWDHYDDLAYIANARANMPRGPRRALYMPMIHESEYLSEDWAYCQRLIEMGEKIWLHTNTECVHWGLAAYKVNKNTPRATGADDGKDQLT